MNWRDPLRPRKFANISSAADPVPTGCLRGQAGSWGTIFDATLPYVIKPSLTGNAEYHEWQDPRVPMRLAYFYFNPDRLSVQDDLVGTEMPLAPRLFFKMRHCLAPRISYGRWSKTQSERVPRLIVADLQNRLRILQLGESD
jgi:hypothetical protein